MIRRTSSRFIGPVSLMTSRRERPFTHFIEYHMKVAVVPTRWIGTM
jgi:hypothetical protein